MSKSRRQPPVKTKAKVKSQAKSKPLTKPAIRIPASKPTRYRAPWDSMLWPMAAEPLSTAPATPAHYLGAAEAHAKAGNLVQGDRASTHGDFIFNFDAIAAVWNGYLQAKFRELANVLDREDVAQLMVFMKVARTMNGKHNSDDYVDEIGYGMIAAGLAAAKQEPST